MKLKLIPAHLRSLVHDTRHGPRIAVLLALLAFATLFTAPRAAAREERAFCFPNGPTCFNQWIACGGYLTGIDNPSHRPLTARELACNQAYFDCARVCRENLISGVHPTFLDATLAASAVGFHLSGTPTIVARVGFVSETNTAILAGNPMAVTDVQIYAASLADFQAHSNALEVSWVSVGSAALEPATGTWNLNIPTSQLPTSAVLRADLGTLDTILSHSAFLLMQQILPPPARIWPTGYHPFSFPFDTGSNTLSEIFSGSSVPDGTLIQKFIPATQSYEGSVYDLGQWVPELTLRPGEGAFLMLPAPFTLQYRGQSRLTETPVALSNNPVFIGRQTYGPGRFENITGSRPEPGAVLTRFVDGSPITHTNMGGNGWQPPYPLIPPGEAVAIRCTNCTTPAPQPPELSSMTPAPGRTNPPTDQIAWRIRDLDEVLNTNNIAMWLGGQTVQNQIVLEGHEVTVGYQAAQPFAAGLHDVLLTYSDTLSPSISYTQSARFYITSAADSDHDGMPDAWETRYGLNPGDPADAGVDSDGDGHTNLREYLAGTDPTSAANVLRLDPVSITAGGFTFRVQTVTNAIYTLERSVVVTSGGTWEAQQTILGTGGPVTVTQPVQGPTGFFRVRLLQRPEPNE